MSDRAMYCDADNARSMSDVELISFAANGLGKFFAQAELARRDRWYATYNAALPGLTSREQSYSLQSTEHCEAEAEASANRRHGEIPR